MALELPLASPERRRLAQERCLLVRRALPRAQLQPLLGRPLAWLRPLWAQEVWRLEAGLQPLPLRVQPVVWLLPLQV